MACKDLEINHGLMLTKPGRSELRVEAARSQSELVV